VFGIFKTGGNRKVQTACIKLKKKHYFFVDITVGNEYHVWPLFLQKIMFGTKQFFILHYFLQTWFFSNIFYGQSWPKIMVNTKAIHLSLAYIEDEL
jgi:hypothetical protein